MNKRTIITKLNNILTNAHLRAMGVCGSLIFVITITANATPIVDGILSDNDGYTSFSDVTFGVKNASTTVSGGELWYYTDADTGDVYLLFSQPKDLVDNSYGANAIGWGSNVGPSGKNHAFNNLVRSDNAQFVFTDGLGNTVLDITVDYFSEFKEGKGKKAIITGYGTSGVTGSDAAVDIGQAS